LNTGDKLSEEQEEAFRAFLPTVTTAPATESAAPAPAPAPAEAAEKPKPKRKVTKAKPVEEAAAEPINLLLPADEAPASAAPTAATATATAAPAPAVGAFDRTLKTHASRIQVINHAKCMGRRLGDTVAGTTKECGAPKLINHEKQCASAPKAGAKLCATCEKYEAEKTTKWQGRLDEAELYPKAAVVGSGLFWDKYPNGIASDPTTVPPAAAAATATAATELATPVKAKGKKAATAPGAPKKANAATAAAPAPAAEESVADTSAPIAESEWKIIAHEGRQVALNLKTNRVYEVDITKLGSDIKDAVKMDQCIGVRQGDGTIDPYGIDSDEE